MPTFSIGATDFLLDGQPFVVRSGALHYFRVHPELWVDRIRKARLMGLNTVETYVPWNFHSSHPGEFRTDGARDLGRFLDLVHAEGMLAIVRPGPYICAEWDNGGLPAWLFAEDGVGIRSKEPRYLEHVGGYLDAVLPIVAERQVTRDGPVILVQVENEYGAFGSDASYLESLATMIRDRGIEVPLTTCDQADDAMLSRGGLPELHRTATFGTRTTERLATLRRHQPTGPLMCMEFWDGWFDSWGRPHHTTPAEAFAAELDALLTAGASFSLYMFHGGTNFGFSNGANHKGRYLPIVTSYDYDAPLSEDGHPTGKFHALRRVLAGHGGVPDEVVPDRVAAPASAVALPSRVALTDVVDRLGTWRTWSHLPTVEETGQWSGVTLYRTRIEDHDELLSFAEIRDAAYATIDGDPLGTLWRTSNDHTLLLPRRSGLLDLYVENQGRVNYGPRIGEAKGLIGPARSASRTVTAWQTLGPDLEALDERVLGPLTEAPTVDPSLPVRGLTFCQGTFDVSDPVDHHLALDGWGRCLVWVNSTLLGRYWAAGPTGTLYVPGPMLRRGRNELVVLELTGARGARVSFVEAPVLGHTEE